MPRTRKEKKVILDKVSDIVKGAKSMVFVNFNTLKVADANAMRRKFKADKIGYFVSKKSLTEKALKDANVAGEMPKLPGQIGIAYGEDLTAPAREVFGFQKKLKDIVSIVGGVFEGKFMTKEEMTAIASIPSENTLRAMFVNVINSPIQGFVMALGEIAKKKQ